MEDLYLAVNISEYAEGFVSFELPSLVSRTLIDGTVRVLEILKDNVNDVKLNRL